MERLKGLRIFPLKTFRPLQETSITSTPNSTAEASTTSSSPSSCMATNNNAPKYGTRVPNRVFVGGLSADTTEPEMTTLFLNYGIVTSTKIISDRAGVSKGYGFVTFETEEEAKNLLRTNDVFLKNRKLNIAPAIKKQSYSRSYDAPSPSVSNGSVYYSSGMPYSYTGGMGYYPQSQQSEAYAAAAAAAAAAYAPQPQPAPTTQYSYPYMYPAQPVYPQQQFAAYQTMQPPTTIRPPLLYNHTHSSPPSGCVAKASPTPSSLSSPAPQTQLQNGNNYFMGGPDATMVYPIAPHPMTLPLPTTGSGDNIFSEMPTPSSDQGDISCSNGTSMDQQQVAISLPNTYTFVDPTYVSSPQTPASGVLATPYHSDGYTTSQEPLFACPPFCPYSPPFSPMAPPPLPILTHIPPPYISSPSLSYSNSNQHKYSSGQQSSNGYRSDNSYRNDNNGYRSDNNGYRGDSDLRDETRGKGSFRGRFPKQSTNGNGYPRREHTPKKDQPGNYTRSYIPRHRDSAPSPLSKVHQPLHPTDVLSTSESAPNPNNNNNKVNSNSVNSSTLKNSEDFNKVIQGLQATKVSE